MKSLRLPALAAALAIAACSSPAPTGPALLDPAAPSFDGGNTLGSGNGVASEDGGGMLGSGTLDSESGTTTSSTDDDTERGGVSTMGSGG